MGMDECDSMTTPMATTRLGADLQGTPTNQKKYLSMIGWLMYLTASRLDIVFATFMQTMQGVMMIAKLSMYHYPLAVHKSSGCGHSFWTTDTDSTKYRCIMIQRALSPFLAIWIPLLLRIFQLADIFTKALPNERFEYLVHQIGIIMAQQQQRDFPQDQLCPPNNHFDLMDANKKFDLVNLQCPNESKDSLGKHSQQPSTQICV
ncbi:hypothetical protein Tco_1554134 [Tanacetum coccineum]